MAEKKLGKAVKMASLLDNGFGTTDNHTLAEERLQQQFTRMCLNVV